VSQVNRRAGRIIRRGQTCMDDLGVVDELQTMWDLGRQFLDVWNGKTSVRDVEKELHSDAERLVNEEMVVSVAVHEVQSDLMPAEHTVFRLIC